MPARVASSLVAEVYDRSRAARWGLSAERFEAALNASVAQAFAAARPTEREIERHVSSLHLEDLALSAACADGDECAWSHFVLEYRPALHRAANAIDPTGGARELADSLYGELFGLNERDGVRQSLFRYFHGRSSLATWLRAVLSQRYIDRLRAGQRTDSLPEEDSPAVIRSRTIAPDPERPRFFTLMRHALAAAIAALAPRDRLRLGCYYAQDLTLAQIGTILSEHEATVSRHLTRTRRGIREAVERCLREEHGLDETALAECFRSVVDDAGSLDLAELIGATPERKISRGDRSKDQGERRGR